jgi:hypothetical protein
LSAVKTGSSHVDLAWFCLPAVLLSSLCLGRYRRQSGALPKLCCVLFFCVSLTSCGGGFTAPVSQEATQAGTYQVFVINAPSPPDPNFVQTTLIVPLYVGPAQ